MARNASLHIGLRLRLAWGFAWILSTLGLLTLSATGAPPPNDDFASRATLTGVTVEASGSTGQATLEQGEPPLPGEDPAAVDASLWWTWTSPLTGYARLLVSGAYNSCGVFVGSSLPGLTLLAQTPPTLPYAAGSLFPVHQGTSYHIRVGGNGGVSEVGSEAHLILTCSPALANDNFAHRIDLGTGPVSIQASNAVATAEAGEPNVVPEWGRGGRSLWWSWTATNSDPVFLNLAEIFHEPVDPFLFTPLALYNPAAGGPMMRDTSLDVFTGGAVASLQRVAARGDLISLVPAWMQFSFIPQPGKTYAIRVSGHFGIQGLFSLDLAQTTPASVIQTSITNGTVLHTDELVKLRAYAHARAGEIARVRFGIYQDPSFLPAFTEWEFTSLESPFCVTTNFPAGFHRFEVHAADNLGILGHADPVTFVVRPANDDFDRRISLEPAVGIIRGDISASTWEAGEPVRPHFNWGSIWYSWTAPITGYYTFETGYQSTVQLYTGSTIRDLVEILPAQRIEAGNNGYQASFAATAGVRYAVALTGESYNRSTIVARLTPRRLPTLALEVLPEPTRWKGGDAVLLRARAEQPDGKIASVTFLGDGREIGTVTAPPFELAFVLPNGTPGLDQPLTLEAVVVDDAGLTIRTSLPYIRYTGFVPPPANDAFAAAQEVSGVSTSWIASLRGASPDPGEPSQENSIWWHWTAPATGPYTFSLDSGGRGISLGVYQGYDLPHLTEVRRDAFDPGRWFTFARCPFQAVAGERYVLKATAGRDVSLHTGFSLVPARPPTIAIQAHAPEAILFLEEAGTITVNASAPDTSLVRVDLYESDRLVDFRTQAPYEFTVRGDALPYPSSSTIHAVATDSTGLRTESEPVPLQVLHRPPANDDFANRIELRGPSVSIRVVLDGCTRELGDPSPFASCWWSWTAPSTGVYTVLTEDPVGGEGLLEVYRGTKIGSLERITLDGLTRRAVLEVTQGTTYAISVKNGGSSTLRILPRPPPSIRMVSPAPEDRLSHKNGITLVAEAAVPPEGSIQRVTFTVNGWLLDAEVMGSTARATLPADYMANVYVTATVVDDQGLTSTSESDHFFADPAPAANDAFRNATALEGPLHEVDVDNNFPTLEPGEPPVPEAVQGSVWWKWMAPARGRASLWLNGYPGDLFVESTLQVFRGDSLQNLLPVLQSDGNGLTARAEFDATEGETYHVRLLTQPGTSYARLGLVLDAIHPESVLKPQPDGSFTARYAATLDRFWRIESSSNLSQWEPWLESVPSQRGRLEWTDVRPTNRNRRFYRVLPAP